jgi:hypothetical protein
VNLAQCRRIELQFCQIHKVAEGSRDHRSRGNRLNARNKKK